MAVDKAYGFPHLMPDLVAFQFSSHSAMVGQQKGVRCVKLLEWFLQVKVLMVEIASTVSFGMLLVWVLWREYKRLFRR
jgi:hypothetical protein